MYCAPFCAELTPEACVRNQEVACRAIRLLDAGLTIFTLDDVSMDRLFVCGQCRDANTLRTRHAGSRWLDPELVRETCLELARTVEGANWDHGDEEMQRTKRLEYNREWLRQHREYNRERVRRWRQRKKEKEDGYEPELSGNTG
jgi:hypothetical protein